MTALNPEVVLCPESQDNQDLLVLTPKDQDWLDSYGVDSAWQSDTALRQSLNELIELGSLRLYKSVNQDRWLDVVSARISFLNFVGIADDFIKEFQTNYPTITPLDTFISTQRVMHSLGLNAARVVNASQAAIGLAPESVREKMANLTALGLDAARVVNASPAAIGLAPESVREKMANLTALGLDAAQVVNAFPTAIGYAPESVREKMANLTALGLDAAQVVNAFPTAIGYAPESVRGKMANLTALGLDAARVVNALPAAIGYAPESVRGKMANLTALGLDAARVVNATPADISLAPESVREKMLFLRSSARLLRWQNPAEELVNAFPALLGYSTKKLAILRHIAARHVDSTERTSSPFMLRSKLITPLEKYIIAISRLEDDQVLSLSELSREARNIKLDSLERKELASEIAPSMGRIGTMYLDYQDRAAR